MKPDPQPWIFTLPDLHEFPEGSLPSPDGTMSPVRRLPPGLRLLAVGWLDGPIEFPKGNTNPEVVARLLGLGIDYRIDEGSAGCHACYYCAPRKAEPRDDRPNSPFGKGHHLVRLGDVVYMCPALLPHYIVVHGYRPPDVFQDAVIHGTFLTDGNLVQTGEDLVEFELARSAAAAEARGDAEAAAGYRARIEKRREELRAAGRISGFRDRDTGVWRDR